MSNKSESENNTSACANCGKGEEASSDLKACTACKLVKYCNRECQIAHRPQHKRECKKRAKELQDEKLFKQPQPMEDCPICFRRLPSLISGSTYMSCCGEVICTGCIHAFQSRITKEEHDVCPFCRTPPPTSDDDLIKRLENRMELNDANAIYSMGVTYALGQHGLRQNWAKALELWHRASELGYATSYYSIGTAYLRGDGVERDDKKATHYFELAAIEGDVEARRNLGLVEVKAGDMDRAMKHLMVSVKDGSFISLNGIRAMYGDGHTTKDDYAHALRSYQAYIDEIKSDQRDEAAAYSDENKYYESAF